MLFLAVPCRVALRIAATSAAPAPRRTPSAASYRWRFAATCSIAWPARSCGISWEPKNHAPTLHPVGRPGRAGTTAPAILFLGATSPGRPTTEGVPRWYAAARSPGRGHPCAAPAGLRRAGRRLSSTPPRKDASAARFSDRQIPRCPRSRGVCVHFRPRRSPRYSRRTPPQAGARRRVPRPALSSLRSTLWNPASSPSNQQNAAPRSTSEPDVALPEISTHNPNRSSSCGELPSFRVHRTHHRNRDG